MSGPDETEKLNYCLAHIGRRDQQQLQIDSQNSNCPRRSCLFPYSFSPSIIPWKKKEYYFILLMAFFLACYYYIAILNLLGSDMKSFYNRVLYYSWSIRSSGVVSDLCAPACLQEEAIQGPVELQCQQLHWSTISAKTEKHRTKWHKGKHSLLLAKGQGLTLQALYRSPSVLCLLRPDLQANLCNIQDI